MMMIVVHRRRLPYSTTAVFSRAAGRPSECSPPKGRTTTSRAQAPPPPVSPRTRPSRKIRTRPTTTTRGRRRRPWHDRREFRRRYRCRPVATVPAFRTWRPSSRSRLCRCTRNYRPSDWVRPRSCRGRLDIPVASNYPPYGGGRWCCPCIAVPPRITFPAAVAVGVGAVVVAVGAAVDGGVVAAHRRDRHHRSPPPPYTHSNRRGASVSRTPSRVPGSRSGRSPEAWPPESRYLPWAAAARCAGGDAAAAIPFP
mmetsp:Transcript_27620/g.66528  ORF Transcript_27620/g.66528 Transcript_27620/m.66528 type:complete len:254 (-) Transcript_27620:123-884(-)